MALAFMSVSALLLALTVRTSSLVNETFCVGRTHNQCVFTRLGIYTLTAFSSLRFFDSWRSFLTSWSRSTRRETRTKESDMCASFRVLNLQVQ